MVIKLLELRYGCIHTEEESTAVERWIFEQFGLIY